MAFDQATRNLLQRTVTRCREVLAGRWNRPGDGEFVRQLQEIYGISPDGTAAPLEVLRHLPDEEQETARVLRDTIDYYEAGLVAEGKTLGEARREAVTRIAREQAFTVLNRFAALRMAEERGIVLECVRQGVQSEGFQLFLQSAGTAFGSTAAAYRAYLFVLFDELAADLGVLFNRFDKQSLLFPRHDVLESLLRELNGTGEAAKRENLTPEAFNTLWAEDETIGWIYQYYNDQDERKKMREQSSAPRNSRELAVRNQFFTPRYVVEFLTDNTLGRIWYEMTRGQTKLGEKCRYLVRRPNEVFLNPRFLDLHHGLGEWVRDVAQGKFDAAPKDASWDEIETVALLMDGREVAQQIHGKSLSECVDPLFDELEKSGALPPSTFLDLWLLLFSCQRGIMREGNHERFPELGNKVRRVWEAWCEAAAQPPDTSGLSQEELLRQPVIIPVRLPKDPRNILMLDPACGSMHFGLYAFDLYEIIYEEAFALGLIPEDVFGGDSPALDHASVRARKDAGQIRSNDLGAPIDAATARVVILEKGDSGDGLAHEGPYLTQADRKFRPKILREVLWSNFDYQHALAEGWMTPEQGEHLIRGTDAFSHNRLDPLPKEEQVQNLRRLVPKLIIEHNLHGIDIDPRCAQIAGLSLWLRAQKTWQRLGLPPPERPSITRSNIVCAEPMPGEKELLREFVDRSFPVAERGVFLQLLESIFDKMQLAGEAGSLLKIEEEIRGAVAEAKKIWKAGPKLEQAPLFPDGKTQQKQIALDFSGITESDFWEQVEERIYAALRDYAEQAENSGGFQRRLFAEDAARGFAFIDICKKSYDVALMNPPFGDASLPSKPYIEETYGDTKGDVYKAFVECFHARLVPAGYLGIISSRTGFFLGQSEDWRTRVVLRLFRPIALADLGSGVLDAMVEVAAYVLRSLSAPEARDLTHSIVPVLEKVVGDSQDRFSLPKWQAARGGLKRHQAVAELEHLEAHGFIQRSPGDIVRYTPLWHSVKKVTAPPEPVFPPLVCLRALAEEDKGAVLSRGVSGSARNSTFICDPAQFSKVPGQPFAYWVGPKVLSLFSSLPCVRSDRREAVIGASTKDDFRYLRVSWELPCGSVARLREETLDGRVWVSFAKGGTFAHFYSDLYLAVQWRNDGREIKQSISEYRGSRGWGYQWTAALNGHSHYFRSGLTWPRRTNGLSFRILPSGCIFGDKGPAVFVEQDNGEQLLALNGLLSSKAFTGLVALQLARVELAQSFEAGLIQQTPLPPLSTDAKIALAHLAKGAWREKRSLDGSTGTSHAFQLPAIFAAPGNTLAERAAAWAARVRTSEETVAAIQAEIDELAFRLYGLDAADRAALTSTEATGDAEAGEDEEEEAATADANALAADLLGYGLGVAIGRWDIRYATGEQAAPELPDPFAPLPVCPPGQLQNAQGLPARPEDVPAAYPVRIPWDGILVDDPNHPLDLERRVREVIEIIWSGKDGGPTAEAIEHEACEILGVKSLRDYFRKQAGFFADHLKRYSKSRRQAPIYWPLSTASGSYTLWIYYHRLTPDTLFKCLQQFVEPKIREVEQELTRLRAMDAADEGGRKTRDQLAQAEELRDELLAFRDELAAWAPRWKPNLNDGVLITASPLWKLYRLPKWRKDLEACWKKLEAGDYDWAHLAYTLWPARVREKCKTDRSLAIAHGLEDLCQVQPFAPKKKRAAKKAAIAKASDSDNLL